MQGNERKEQVNKMDQIETKKRNKILFLLRNMKQSKKKGKQCEINENRN